MTAVYRADLLRLLSGIEADLRRISATLVEVRAHIAALDIPDEYPSLSCPECGLDLQGGPVRLAEHRYVVHDVPLPEGVE
jgi:hypothetical protein